MCNVKLEVLAIFLSSPAITFTPRAFPPRGFISAIIQSYNLTRATLPQALHLRYFKAQAVLKHCKESPDLLARLRIVLFYFLLLFFVFVMIGGGRTEAEALMGREYRSVALSASE
jgi:hypothetical protein